MEKDPLVSVIIPVYNRIYFLEQCVCSVLSQTYKFVEIILVDDGSTDGSSLLCDSLAVKKSRIHVIHKENGGPSDARNTGLLRAKGKYILFLDSDDFWVSDDDLQLLVSRIEAEESDFLCFNCSYFYSDKDTYVPWKAFDAELLLGVDKDQAIISLVRSGVFPMSPCLKIINRSFLNDNRIFFEKDLSSEDIPWFLDLIRKAQKIGFLNQYMYAYRKGVSNSISSTFSEKQYNDLKYILETELSKIQAEPWAVDVKNAFFSFLAYEYCILLGLTSFFPLNVRKVRLKELEQSVWLLDYHLNPKVEKVHTVQKKIGLNITSYLLKIYLKYCLNVRKKA